MPPTQSAATSQSPPPRLRTGQTALQIPHHVFEHLAVGALHRLAGTGDIGGKRHQRAAIVAVLEMYLRQIGGDELAGVVVARRRGSVLRGFRAAGKNLLHDFGIKVSLGVEVIVEAAAGEPGIGHDLVDGDAGQAVAVEQAPRAPDNPLPGPRLVFVRVRAWHGSPSSAEIGRLGPS
jgi:hypothetical protein